METIMNCFHTPGSQGDGCMWTPLLEKQKNSTLLMKRHGGEEERPLALKKISNKIKYINPFHQGENILDPHRNNIYHTKRVGVFGRISQAGTHIATIATMGSNLPTLHRTSTKLT